MRPDQVGRLLESELADVLVEPGAGRGLDAVGAPSEVDGVEVALEDLALVELALELDGDDRLPQLAPQGGVAAHVDLLDVLLGDRGPALGGALVADVGPRGPGDAEGVDAAVLEELAVLGRDDRVLDDGGHLVELDREAVLLAVEGGQLVAGGVVDDRRLGQGGLGREGDLGEHPRRPGQGGDDDDAEQEPHPPVAPQEAGLLDPPAAAATSGPVAVAAGAVAGAVAAEAGGPCRPGPGTGSAGGRG